MLHIIITYIHSMIRFKGKSLSVKGMPITKVIPKRFIAKPIIEDSCSSIGGQRTSIWKRHNKGTHSDGRHAMASTTAGTTVRQQPSQGMMGGHNGGNSHRKQAFASSAPMCMKSAPIRSVRVQGKACYVPLRLSLSFSL